MNLPDAARPEEGGRCASGLLERSPDPLDFGRNHEKSMIAVELGKFSYRRPKCYDCKDCDGTSLKDSKGEPWRMVLRGSPYKELQMLCGGGPGDLESKLKTLPLSSCDICKRVIDNTLIRWVCESGVDMNNIASTVGDKKIHRPQRENFAETMKGSVTSVCTACISKDGVIDCDICGEVKCSKKHKSYTEENAEHEYATPCEKCKHPVCKYCLIEWSNKCKDDGMPQTTCPFCRQTYEHYTAETAGWTSSLRDGRGGQSNSQFERSNEAREKMQLFWQKMNEGSAKKLRTDAMCIFNPYCIRC